MIVGMTSKTRLKGVCEALCRTSAKIPKSIPLQTVQSREISQIARELKSNLFDITIYGDLRDEALEGAFSIGGSEDYLYPIFTISSKRKGVILKVWVDEVGCAHFVCLGGNYTATMVLATSGDICDWIVDYLWGS